MLLGAALLPLVATIGAKAGGQGFDNAAPREWLQKQAGWRARANAAQNNTFEALPFFYAVMIFAYIRAPMSSAVLWLGILWLLLRLLYIGCYIWDQPSLRSLIWGAAVGVNIRSEEHTCELQSSGQLVCRLV